MAAELASNLDFDLGGYVYFSGLIDGRDGRNDYILLRFWAGWCRACRRTAPASINEFALEKNMQFFTVNVDDDKDTPVYCNVGAIPSYVLMCPRSRTDATQGRYIITAFQTSDFRQLKEWVDQQLLNAQETIGE
jgi:thioredoxin-like negative regulator of GroEL